MIRAFCDANVIISGILGYRRLESTPGSLLRAWYSREFNLVISYSVLSEIERALTKPFIERSVPLDDRQGVFSSLRSNAEFIGIRLDVKGIASHPEDDLVLAAAASARVDFLVTGDRMLLQLGSFEQVPIVSPRHFLDLLSSAGPLNP